MSSGGGKKKLKLIKIPRPLEFIMREIELEFNVYLRNFSPSLDDPSRGHRRESSRRHLSRWCLLAKLEWRSCRIHRHGSVNIKTRTVLLRALGNPSICTSHSTPHEAWELNDLSDVLSHKIAHYMHILLASPWKQTEESARSAAANESLTMATEDGGRKILKKIWVKLREEKTFCFINSR